MRQISGKAGCNSGKCVGILLLVLQIFDHIWFNKSTGQVGTLNTRAEVDEICPLSILKCLRYWRLDESHKDLKLTYYDYSARQFMWIVRISAKTDIKKTFQSQSAISIIDKSSFYWADQLWTFVLYWISLDSAISEKFPWWVFAQNNQRD